MSGQPTGPAFRPQNYGIAGPRRPFVYCSNAERDKWLPYINKAFDMGVRVAQAASAELGEQLERSVAKAQNVEDGTL